MAEASFEWLWEIVPFLAVILIFLKGLQVMGMEALHDIHAFMRKHHKGLLVLTAAIALLFGLMWPQMSH